MPASSSDSQARFQEPALLGIHAEGFPGRNPKKLGIELIKIVNKTTPLGDHFAWDFHVLVVPAFPVPAIFGDRYNTGAAFDQHFPKGFGARDTSRHAAANTNDC